MIMDAYRGHVKVPGNDWEAVAGCTHIWGLETGGFRQGLHRQSGWAV